MLKHTLGACALAAVLIAGQASAHARLQSSSPGNEAQLTAAPKTLRLTFSESARLARLMLSHAGNDVPVTLDQDAPAAKSFDLPLPVLAPGKYTVQWTAVAADDGHVTKGSFVFSIAG